MAHAGGRPPKLTPEQRKEVLEAYKLYIQREPDPTTVGFCAWDPVAAKYFLTRHNIEDWSEFSALQQYAIEKQEAYMVKGAITNKLNPTMAIFRLKQPQHGYKDRVDSDVTSNGETIGATVTAEQAAQLIAARKARESADI